MISAPLIVKDEAAVLARCRSAIHDAPAWTRTALTIHGIATTISCSPAAAPRRAPASIAPGAFHG